MEGVRQHSDSKLEPFQLVRRLRIFLRPQLAAVLGILVSEAKAHVEDLALDLVAVAQSHFPPLFLMAEAEAEDLFLHCCQCSVESDHCPPEVEEAELSISYPLLRLQWLCSVRGRIL